MSAPEDLETRALGFLARVGNDLDRRRAGAAGGGEGAPLLDVLVATQSDAGAFRFADVMAGDAVAGTLHALAILADARLSGADAVAHAVSWLESHRQPDASWAIEGAGEHAQHLATGFLAGFLAQSPFTRAHVLEEAGAWLAAHWSPELVRGGEFAMLAAYAHFFSSHPHEQADPILQWCGRELERGVRGGVLPALFALRVFSLCEAPVFPGSRIDAVSLLETLAKEQAPDGGWLAEAPARWRVAATLVGLEAWRRFCRGRPFANGR